MFRLIALIVFVIAAGSSLTIRGKAERAGEKMSWGDEGAVIMVGLRLCGMVMWLSIVAAIAYPPLVAWAALPLPDAARWAGVACALACWPMLVWTLRTIGRNITQTVGIRSGHELVTSGPYAIVRHPLYTFGTLFMFGMGVTLASGLTLAAAALGLAFLIARLPNEERRLVEAFGDDYSDYMARTGGLIPRPSRARDA